MAGYDMYFGKMLFPVAPSKITTKIKGKNQTYDLINEGEMNILKLAGLTTMSFEVLLPAVVYPFATYLEGFKQPSYYLNELESLKQSRKPFQFILSRHSTFKARQQLHDTNMTCSIEDYQIKESAKDNGFDIVVEIKLKQYKEYITKTFTVEVPLPNAPIAIEPERPETTDEVDYSNGGGGSSGGEKKEKLKKYKIQIPGMGVVEVYSYSEATAVSRVCGKWTGTVYVNGQQKTTEKGKLKEEKNPVKNAANNSSKTTIKANNNLNSGQKAAANAAKSVTKPSTTKTTITSNTATKANTAKTNKSMVSRY